jgi:methyltransferase (TIGR00027 family)
MTDSIIQNVPDTAFMAAAYRAMESEIMKPLFVDPLADKLAGTRGRAIIASLPPKAMMGGWTVVIRTCVIDKLILQAIAQGVDTIINLGAGLDTRPYRMALPKTLRWFEADFQHIIDWKNNQLANELPNCQLKRISLDLTDTNARQKFLDEAVVGSKKILVLTEAVTPYLTEEAVAAIGLELRSRLVIQYWIVDYFSPSAYEYRRRSGMSQAMKHSPFLFEPKDYFSFFSNCGWAPKQIKYLGEEAEHLGRPAPFPWLVKLFFAMLRLVMSPEKRRAAKQYAGFVLFEPSSEKGKY